MIGIAFNGNRQAYVDILSAHIATITDDALRSIAMHVADGSAMLGSIVSEGISGSSGEDVFVGGGGGDLLSGEAGSDIYVYGKHDGDLWIKDASASHLDMDRLLLTDLNSSDVSFERFGDNLLIKVASTGRTIVSESFFSNFSTQHLGIDLIRFADGTEWGRVQIKDATIFKGDDHNNLVQDSSIDDVIYGGKGNDLIQISQGNDTILYAKGDGYDVIQDRDLGSSGREVFHLTDLNSSDIELSRVGPEALILTIKATGEYIQFDQFFTRFGSQWSNYKGSIDEIKFANGEVWDRSKIQENAWYRGTERGESLSGGDLNDTIDGGKGDDLLEGGSGSDTFIWRKGDGNDQISDVSRAPSGDVDTLHMIDVTSDDVAFSYQGDTLLITVGSTGEIIRIPSFFWGVYNLHDDANTVQAGIDVIKFSDGETLDRQQIYTLTGQEFLGKDRETHSYYINVEGVSTLVWMYFTDEFGHSGNLWSNMATGGDDVYDQQVRGVANWSFDIGDANNVMNGWKGSNILVGGGGQDVLYGGEGDGKDILYGDRAGDASYGASDILDGGDGADMLFGGGGSDILNGGSGNDYLSGDDGADILDGGGGNDIYIGGKGDDFLSGDLAVTGASGSDTYIYSLGDGNDVISESLDWPGNDVDVLEFKDINPGEIELTRVGDDLQVRIKSTGEIIRVLSQFSDTNNSNAPGGGIEVIRFANGIEWTRTVIQQSAWYRGTEGRDVIVAGSNLTDQFDQVLSDTIEGGKGDDLLYTGYQGASGNDMFVYSRGDGNDIIYDQTWRSTFGTLHNETDTLKFTDINSSDVQLTRSGNDLLVRVLSSNETITIVDQFAADVSAPGEGLEYIRFANGESWGRDRIQKEAWFRGTDGRDLIDVQVGAWNDVIEGGKGDDIIITGNMGASGNDTYVYATGDGNDVITDKTWAHFGSNEIDLLKLTDIDASDIELSRSGDNLLIKIVSTNETITIVSQFAESFDVAGQGLEYIQFANGERWGRDTIAGIIASQVPFIAGTNHDDTLVGTSAAQNIYGETGNDVIDGRGGSDLLYGGLGDDTLKMGISGAGDLVVVQGGAGADTLDVSEFGAAVWLDLVTSGAELRTRDQSDLSSGTWRDMAQVETIENVIGTEFSDEIYGDAGNNVLRGNGGSDVLEGRSGNDQLSGDEGDDVLIGGMGNDYLDGGEGADVLNGGLDQDILVGGQGNDTLTGGTGSDVFTFGPAFGDDVIADFSAQGAEVDVIRFDRSLFTNFASVMAAATQIGSDVVISVAGNTLTLQNVILSSLSSQNFDFHQLNNQAPTSVEVDGGSVVENAASGTVVATLSAIDSDIGDSHTFTLVGMSDLFEIVNNEIRVKAGAVIDFEAASEHTIVVMVTDAEGQSTTSPVLISVADSDDVLNGTAGDNVINGGAGIDIISGGGGNDQLVGFAGSDTYLYNLGDGEDRVLDEGNAADVDKVLLGVGIAENSVEVGRSSLSGQDIVLRFADGGLIILQNQLSDVAGTGVEEIRFSDNSIWTRADILAHLDAGLIIGTSQNDILSGSASVETFDSSSGDDLLRGFGAGDTYKFSGNFGHDRILEGNDIGIDRVQFDDLNFANVELIRSGDDLFISVGSTENSVMVTGQFTWAGSGIEQIAFANGTVLNKSQIQSLAYILGTNGNDVVTGTEENDLLRGGHGNDTLDGGAGDDTYVYFLGDGNDIINDEGSSPTTHNVLKFGDLDPSDLEFTRQGDNLVIEVVSNGETITIIKQFISSAAPWGIQGIVFAGGIAWDRQTILQSASWIRGTSGNDTLSGFSGDDVFYGDLGDDRFNSGSGSDTYVYASGDGNDTIAEGSGSTSEVDILRLIDLTATDVALTHAGRDLQIRINATGETITVVDQFYSTTDNFGLEKIEFSDGSSWDRAAIRSNAWYRGTSGNDNLSGSSAGDTFLGAAGNDSLSGGTGSDTYVYASGDGNDSISDGSGSSVDVDALRLVDVNASDVTLTRVGRDLQVGINATGGKITIVDQFYSMSDNYGIEKIEFADGSNWNLATINANAWYRGTSGNDSLSGSSWNDTFFGGAGNDSYGGGAGNDTYVYASGSGNDSIADGSGTAGEVDTLRLTDLTASDVTLSRVGRDLQVGINATGEKITIFDQFYSMNENNGIEKIEFSNGNSWNLATINANAWYRGTSGNDSLSGSSWNDTFFGGAGNDSYGGGAGSDTYVYASGSGNDSISDGSGSTLEVDVLRLTDLNAGDITLSRVGRDLQVGINSTGEKITVFDQFYSMSENDGIEKIEFADGSSWNLQTINSNAWYRGTSGNDTISGSSWNDTFKGGLGDDRFNSGQGSDTYVYSLGDGNDYIDDESGSTTDVDTLRFTDLNASDLTFSRVGVHLVVTVNSNGQTVTLDEQFYSQNDFWGLEKVEFANGSSWDRATLNSSAWYRGTTGNDTISGSSWNDTIYGDAGNDILSGGDGDDTFVFRPGFGQDTINDFSVGHDKLQFHGGVFADAAAAFAAASTSGSDTVVTIDASTQILLKNVALANLHVDDFRVV